MSKTWALCAKECGHSALKGSEEEHEDMRVSDRSQAPKDCMARLQLYHRQECDGGCGAGIQVQGVMGVDYEMPLRT
jgi:hypothetical protein